MLLTHIREGILTDDSKVYDCVVYDFDQPEGEDRIVICCKDEESAINLSLAIEEAIERYVKAT